MNLFVSYAFNDENRWIEELAIPLIKALGFEVVTGRRMEGGIIVQEVLERMRLCRGCIAFTTRRGAADADGMYGTHQWVLDELSTARGIKIPTVEVREDVVKVEGAAESYVQLRYASNARDKLLVELAQTLAKWPTRVVRVRIQPPQDAAQKFLKLVLRGGVECRYQVQSGGKVVANGVATIEPVTAGFFVDLEVPNGDVIVQLEIKGDATVVWRSIGSSLGAVPIEVYDL